MNLPVERRAKLASACPKTLDTRTTRAPSEGFYKAYRSELSVEIAFLGTLKALEIAASRQPTKESVQTLESQLRNLTETRDRLDSYEERRPT